MSAVDVLIKFAPVHTLERHNDPAWNRAGRSLDEIGSLRFAPGRSTVPLVVDHREEREVGIVHKIFRADWSDGPWWMASATLTEPPAWLEKYGTRASFGFHPYERRTFTEGELVAAAFVSEVSLLSPATTPAEPLAQVVLVQRSPLPPSTAPPTGEVTLGHGRIARRYGGQILRVR